MKLTYLALVLGLGVGCASPGADQIITGRVDTNFPSSVTDVQIVRNGTVVATARLAPDRSFTLAVPPGSGTSIQLVGANKSQLVFPRHTGTTQKAFSVRAGGSPFDLGALHYVGDTSTTPVVFHDGTTETECDDGLDASGAVCADDSDDDHGTCEAEGADDGETADDEGTSTDDGLADDGDAVADHNFPADGCSDDDGSDDDAADDGADGADV